MKKYFVTYGDDTFAKSKERIIHQAKQLGHFDQVISYSPEKLSDLTKKSPLMQYKRGGGLWIWKADIILQTLQMMDDGDYLLYCDAGCTLQESKEWGKYFSILTQYDICALRIFQRNIQWTRKEIITYFDSNPSNWLESYQCCAGVVLLKKSELSLSFIKEWLNIMLEHPNFVKDVEGAEKVGQDEKFIENRHDQAVYSALIYKYFYTGMIKIIKEHIEGRDYLVKQAIMATRITDSNSRKASFLLTLRKLLKNIMKSFYRIIRK